MDGHYLEHALKVLVDVVIGRHWFDTLVFCELSEGGESASSCRCDEALLLSLCPSSSLPVRITRPISRCVAELGVRHTSMRPVMCVERSAVSVWIQHEFHC